MSLSILFPLGWLVNKKAARVEVNISLAFLHWVEIALHPWTFVSDIAIFVLKGDVKLQLTDWRNGHVVEPSVLQLITSPCSCNFWLSRGVGVPPPLAASLSHKSLKFSSSILENLLPSVLRLRKLLHDCKNEFAYLDVNINTTKTCFMSISPRYDKTCGNLTTQNAERWYAMIFWL